MVGVTYDSNNCGKFTVLSKCNRTDFYHIRFHDTGTIKKVRGYQIKTGCVRDPYAKTVCGVACVGNIKTKGKYNALYSVWRDMINRCYNPKNKHYKTNKNVTVDNYWLCFENFYKDAKEIDGYDIQKINTGQYVLDKDLKQRKSAHKTYSKQTCIWVEKSINNQIQDAQQNEFIAVSPEGKIFHDFNITRFAKEHGLKRRHISGVLHGRAHSTAGWRFSYQNIV